VSSVTVGSFALSFVSVLWHVPGVPEELVFVLEVGAGPDAQPATTTKARAKAKARRTAGERTRRDLIGG